MKIILKDKEYNTGKLVMHHAIEAMAMQKRIVSGEMSEIESVTVMIEILAESLINGTERIPYDEITADKKAEYCKLIKFNMALDEVEPIYVEILNDMSGKHKNDEGK